VPQGGDGFESSQKVDLSTKVVVPHSLKKCLNLSMAASLK